MTTPTTKTNKRGAQFKSVLTRGGINVRGCVALGSFVTIDSYMKYESQIDLAMTSAGFKRLVASNGRHLDGTTGPRFAYQLKT